MTWRGPMLRLRTIWLCAGSSRVGRRPPLPRNRRPGAWSPTFTPSVAAARAGADLAIACPQDGASMDGVHVVVPPNRVADLFTLSAASWRQRGWVWRSLPSILNLSGIFLWYFSPLTVLLVDFGGMGAGLINAVWTPPRFCPERAKRFI
ncbi:MAG: hypothetical protein R3A10_06255 [Caldilineaceae bacterium]